MFNLVRQLENYLEIHRNAKEVEKQCEVDETSPMTSVRRGWEFEVPVVG